MSEERLWSIVEVAEFFGVHSTTVHGWLRAGYFPGHYKKGPGKTSPYVIPDSDVQRLKKQIRPDDDPK